ncbi:MAG TPA: NAD(P)H-binding protein [Gammaproteobacteria bacterium]|nr:NAD(P)H-binding protein [Gammaproteobacteria bacterium]MDP7154037.1 NAD(P)H-binding protein [Gammaproteobacteria bacterium]MDP7661435.1 NAD(P)H-binding protein [Gammaproteobacteria bacterium]HJP39444.1 NAD(P)H-binding protein [Gammaproteobacteria bacterium]
MQQRSIKNLLAVTIMPICLAVFLTACSGPAPDEEAQAAADAPKSIAVIGATARSGRVIIAQALEAGFQVTGLARSPEKFGYEHENLTLVKGDVRDAETLKAALTGSEVVICMVGKSAPADPSAPIGEVDLYTVMGANLLETMAAKGNKRLIMASSTGVEHRVPNEATEPEGPGMSNAWRFNARYLYNDMAAMEEQIVNSGLDYILLRPGFMVEEPARNDMQFAIDGGTPGGRTITYEDFSAFILANLESDEYVGKAVGMYSDEIMDPAKETKKFLEKMRLQNEAEAAAAEQAGG